MGCSVGSGVRRCIRLGIRLGIARGIKSVAIGGDQFQSVAISAGPPLHLHPAQRQPTISGNQSVAISAGLQLRLQPSQCQPAISGNQWQSVPISGNQWQSVRWQSVATTSHTEIGGVLQGCRCVGTHSRRGIRWGIRRGIRRGIGRSTTVGGVLGGVLPSVAISGNHFPPEERFGHSTVM